MSDYNNVTWKWLAGIAMTILILGGGAWMTTMYAQVNNVQEEQRQDRQTINDVKGKVGVIEERTRRTEEDVKDIKEGQKEQGRKLDELLRRTR